MADEEKGTKPEDEGDESLVVDEEPAKKFSMTPIIVAMYVGIVLAASFVTERIIVPAASRALAEKGYTRELEKPEPKEEFGEIYVIEDLIVNPAGSGGTRYLATSVGLQPANADVLARIEKRDAQIKDSLLRILGSRTVEDLADVNSRERIRTEIKVAVEESIVDGEIDAVYFVSFVLQ